MSSQKRYREKHPERYKEQQRNWRQSDSGKFRRNKSHWSEAGIVEPEIGWRPYWDIFKETTNCEVCNIVFGSNKDNSVRCLDHHHGSGHIRNIICRKCNKTRWSIDGKHKDVLLELHREFILRFNF